MHLVLKELNKSAVVITIPLASQFTENYTLLELLMGASLEWEKALNVATS
jgi:hypothetical protein